MKKLALQSCFLLLITDLTFSGCSKDTDKGPLNNMPAAGLMYLVNSGAGAESVLLYRVDRNFNGPPPDGGPIALKYTAKNYSGAHIADPRSRKFTITIYNNDQTVLIDTALTINVDSGYTSFVYGTNE